MNHKISKKWYQMAEFYKRFNPSPPTQAHLEYFRSVGLNVKPVLDFSEQAAWEMYQFESTGTPKLQLSSETTNGYLVGKHWMDVSIKMWKEDLKSGLLDIVELYQEYGGWFVDKMVK